VPVLMALLATASVGADPAGPPFPRIANCYACQLTPDCTDQDIDEIARYDLLIGGVWAQWDNADSVRKLGEAMRRVRECNPDIIILDFSSSAPYASLDDPFFPANGWLHQPNGSMIEGWPGTRMINLTRPEVIDWLVARSVASVRLRGFDGSFIDCMGSGFDAWACNIEHGDPYEVDADEDGRADPREVLDERWVAAKTELSRRVRAALGGDAVFMTNQAGDWGLPTMNGILLEDYLDYVLDRGASWDKVLEDYLRWCAGSRKPTVTTIVSSSAIEPPFNPWSTMTAAERDALLERGRSLVGRMRFGLTTTLMGDGYFAYDLHTRWRGQRWWYPEYDAPLGYPKGAARQQADGAWRREFDGGTVIVNPSLLDVRVRFAERHRDVSTGKVDREFTIPTMDGRLLLPTRDPENVGSLPGPEPVFTVEGPLGIVERDGMVLCRVAGAAALFDANGRLVGVTDGRRRVVGVTDGRRRVVGAGQHFIVADDHWRDFAYADWSHEVMGTTVRFAGKRTDGDAVVSCIEEVHIGPAALAITYDFTADTPLHAHMWRQQIDLPVADYAGQVWRGAGRTGQLPRERAVEPRVAGPLDRLTVIPAEGTTVTIRTSGPAWLVDERHYGVEAYRLGYAVTQGDVTAGARLRSLLRIEIRPAP